MEIKIKLTEKFLMKGTNSSKIKTYYQLDQEEERALWDFLDDIIDYNNLEGKNKPSNIIDKRINGNIIIEEIKNNKGLTFFNRNLWHYHIASKDYPYGNKQYYNKLTTPILNQNLNGLTTSLLIHYSKKEFEDHVLISIWGMSHHSCWSDLYQTINK